MCKYVSFKLNPVVFMYPSCVPFMDNITELLCQPLWVSSQSRSLAAWIQSLFWTLPWEPEQPQAQPGTNYRACQTTQSDPPKPRAKPEHTRARTHQAKRKTKKAPKLSTGWACTLLQVCNTFLSRKKCLWMIRKTRQHPSSWSKNLNIMKQYVSTLTVKQSEVEAKYTYLITVLQLHILVFTRVFILVPALNANISMSSLLIFPTRLITLALRHRRGVFIFPSKHRKWLAGGTKTQKMILLEHPSLLFMLKQSAAYTEYF